MGRKWKYPQAALLLIGTAIAVYSAIDFSRPNDYVEAYSGTFGPWRLRLAAEEMSRPGGRLGLVAWISSPAGRANYKQLRVRLINPDQTTADESELKGSMLLRRGRLTLPESVSEGSQLRLIAELRNGETFEVETPLAPLMETEGS